MKNMPPTLQPNAAPRRRRKLSVEVYFVLYLTAIMLLLLGTTPFSNEEYNDELEQAIAQLVNTDFEIDVEKIAMLVPFIPAGMETESLSVDLRRDSMNVIRAHGSFSRVDFRIVGLEDTTTGQSLSVENAALVHDGDSSVVFTWNQGETNRAAVYRVMVEAEARPAIPESVNSPVLRERIESIIYRHKPMRDTAIFTINVLPFTSSEYLLAVQNPPMLSNTPGDSTASFLASFLQGQSGFNTITAYPQSDFVKVPLGSSWEQRVIILGPNPSEVSFALPRGVEIISLGADHVYVGGTTTRDENRVINIGISAPNRQSTQISFRLETSNLNAPSNLPEVFYAGDSYRLDFGSEGVSDSRISVRIVENGQVVQRESQTGAVVIYSPSAQKGRVEFIRFFDDKQVNSYSRDILGIPDPVMRTLEHSDRQIKVETVTYGKKDGRPNTAVLRVMDGNAKEARALGGPQIESSTGKITQQWVIEVKDESQRLSFTVKVWDLVHGYGQAKTQSFGE